MCFGIGKFSESTTSRYQFALLLYLRKFFDIPVTVYEPLFDQNELQLLKHFEVNVMKQNCEGKYEVGEQNSVIFFLPHCPKQLSNNLLWANWNKNLANCVIISNSFDEILHRGTSEYILKNVQYIARISSQVVEIPLKTPPQFYEMFNDMAIHVFPIITDTDFWKYSPEPVYDNDDLEFIKDTPVISS